MRWAAVAVGLALLAGCAKPIPVWTKAEEQRTIAEMAKAQQRILHDLPPAGPDEADEPKAVDLSGTDVTLTYWAPNFVIGIATSGDPLLAVTTELQFPPRGTRVDDPRSLPAKVSWTTSERCPALTKVLPELDSVVHRFVTPRTAPPRRAPASEFDGGGYLVRIEGDFTDGHIKGGALILSGQDDTPLGQWAMETRETLRSCWKPLASNQR